MEDVEQAIKEAEMAGRNCLIKRGNINPTISNGHLVFDSLEEAEQYYGCVISKYCEFDTAEKYRWSLMYMDRFYWKPKDRMISRIKDGSLFRDLGWKDWPKGLR